MEHSSSLPSGPRGPTPIYSGLRRPIPAPIFFAVPPPDPALLPGSGFTSQSVPVIPPPGVPVTSSVIPQFGSVPDSTLESTLPLLKVGTRVRRGRDWKWDDQDGGSGNFGTVMKDQLPTDEWVEVRWDNGHLNHYRFGQGPHVDLEVVPDAPPAPFQTIGLDLLKAGTRVRRGRDWKWDDQDGGGGNLGTVTKDQSPGDDPSWKRLEMG
eukprot:TRINITY_DN82_c0_g1_i5.p1 TRINITY_DN82_c0_g1~~TRINITY_DN82_c0_g1_i5.p1  ORF type:complete len:209 (+),score=58.76 TRINITY_DN82_c0_g1_i5:90-716(+)